MAIHNSFRKVFLAAFLFGIIAVAFHYSYNSVYKYKQFPKQKRELTDDEFLIYCKFIKTQADTFDLFIPPGFNLKPRKILMGPYSQVIEDSTVSLPDTSLFREQLAKLTEMPFEKELESVIDTNYIVSLARLSKIKVVILVTPDTLRKIKSRSKNFWTSFYKVFAQTSGLIDFSKIVFNQNRNFACVEFNSISGPETGAGRFYILKKNGNSWDIVFEQFTWVC